MGDGEGDVQARSVLLRSWLGMLATVVLMLSGCGGGLNTESTAIQSPSVLAVDVPAGAKVNVPLALGVRGTDLGVQGGIHISLPGCSSVLQVGEQTETSQTYSCTPTQAGWLQGTISNSVGGVLLIFGVQVNAEGGFTKISADGSALPDAASDWSCVRHNATGLLWEAHVRRGVDAADNLISHPCSLNPASQCYGFSNLGNGDPWDAPSVNGSVCGKPGRLPTEAEGRALVNDTAFRVNNLWGSTFQTTWFGADDRANWGWTSSADLFLPTFLAMGICFPCESAMAFLPRNGLYSTISVRLVAGP